MSASSGLAPTNGWCGAIGNGGCDCATICKRRSAASHCSVVDGSDYYALVGARGAHVRAALAHGCPLDLDKFAVDSCAQTRFRRAAIMLFRAADRDGEPVFEIQTRWSFADYVWRVLARAGELTAAAARAGD